ncbi:MAG: hypothetical protein JWO31_2707 [Phycisphaerales bacterium]|nr:hypothetical protein [Phycisphaerales bacterium]
MRSATRRVRRPAAQAFTLIEMVAVLALAALLATAATVSLKGTRRDAAVDDAAGRWRAYDAAARDLARQSGRPVTLRIRAGGGGTGDAGPVARRLDADGRADLGPPVDLPGGPDGVRVDRVLTPPVGADPGAGVSAGSGGAVDVPVSARGFGPSYAVRLAGPGGRTRWLLVAGLTGEVRTVPDEQYVRNTFRLLAGGEGGVGAADQP